MLCVMRWFALILCLMSPSWAVAENYLCIQEKAVGFSPKDGNFQETFFIPDRKYLVSTKKRTLSIFGSAGPPHVEECEVATLFVSCDNERTQFTIQKQNLRFMVYHLDWAYVWEGDTRFASKPIIAIGTCSKF